MISLLTWGDGALEPAAVLGLLLNNDSSTKLALPALYLREHQQESSASHDVLNYVANQQAVRGAGMRGLQISEAVLRLQSTVAQKITTSVACATLPNFKSHNKYQPDAHPALRVAPLTLPLPRLLMTLSR